MSVSEDLKAVGILLIGIFALIGFTITCISIGEWFAGVVFRMGMVSVAAGTTAYLLGLGVAVIVGLSVVTRIADNRWWWQ